jgi:cobalt/nickel transport system permease protein
VASTPAADLLRGLERLHVPGVLVAVAGLMVRYLTVLSEEMHRLRVARLSRAADPRRLLQARDVAATAGALFVRSYERGERVYVATVSRGYQGALPALGGAPAGATAWAAALAVPALAAVVTTAAWLLR